MASSVFHVQLNTKRLPRTLAARLYCAGGLGVFALGALALASIYFARHTSAVALRMRELSVVEAGAAANLELLFERHRRLIETAPLELDPAEIERSAKSADGMARGITTLVMSRKDPFLESVAFNLQDYISRARLVLSLASDQQREAAVAAAKRYADLANRMQYQIGLYRSARLAGASGEVAQLMASAEALVRWITAVALAAFLLIGPFSLFIIRRTVARLGGITETMRRLARNETSVAVPSIRDLDEVGEMARAVAVFKSNAVALRHHQEEIEKLNGWFDVALNNMAQGLSMFDGAQRLIVCNRNYRRLYALPDGLAKRGTPFAAIIDHWQGVAKKMGGGSAEETHSDGWLQGHRRQINASAQFVETRRLADGRVIAVNCQPLASGGWVDVHEDVTEKQRSEERISQLACFDTLTGLSNRHHFLERVEAAFRDSADGRGFALQWLDLDRFKEVNDTLGHPAGDALLRQVAERLAASVRQDDVVARLGGDEFAILQKSGAVGAHEASVLARRLISTLSQPYQVLGNSVSIGASAGIALAPCHGTTPDDLFMNADLALYRAKTQGRGRFVFFEEGLQAEARERRQIETDLRRALEGNQLELHYQPIIDLGRRTVTGFEALLRWRHPERGPIPPAVFIPIAEEAGFIAELGAWVLQEACREASGWPGNVRVSVNLSAAHFAASDLGAVTFAALEASGLPPSRLDLEVTETLLLRESPKTNATLHELRNRGVGISLDDFGTGYASLSYLRSFPFDKIKIDQTFVRDLHERRDCVAIVRAVAELAKTLGMRTVAEGVETREHLELVAAAGCNEAQGYYFSRPVPASQVGAVIARCSSELAAA